MKTKQQKQSEALQRIERRIQWWEHQQTDPVLGDSMDTFMELSNKDNAFVWNEMLTPGVPQYAAVAKLATGKLKSLNRDAANLRKKLGWN